MELRGTKLLQIDIGESREKIGNIFIPSSLQLPSRVGKVIGRTRDCECMVGDYVSIYLHHPNDYNSYQHFIVIDGRSYLLMDEDIIQFRFKHRDMGQKNIGRDDLQIDPWKDMVAIGKKVIIEIDKEEEKKESGIIELKKTVYEKMGKVGITGTICTTGKDANYAFLENVLAPGVRVMAMQGMAGGPIKVSKNDQIWVSSGMNFTLYLDEDTDEWEPLGGWTLCRGKYTDIKLHDDGYYRNEQGIVISDAHLPPPRVFEIVKVGKGWSKEFVATHKQTWYDPKRDQPKVGEHYASTAIFGMHNQFLAKPISLVVNGKEELLYLINVFHLEARIQSSKQVFDSFAPLVPKVSRESVGSELNFNPKQG